MTHTRRMTVYLRSPVPDETERRQASVLGRTDSLRQQGLLDDVSVKYWHRLSTGTDPRETEDIAAMAAWAEANDCSLTPTFDRHDRHSAFTGDDSVVTLPVVCLSYWEDGELVGVYPHRGSCGHCTVADGLDRIEAALQSGEALAHTGSQR
ncbi:HTH domain-containing protein [Haloarcula sp. JP-L23]|uniref:HTH domain-containing protein n=1 Tax=Haloarcula sp. JP-L23 TaxID=2716717 RepID=UPI00140F3C3C|nr:hypothetical protein G9465_11500 [Haloarcula sp. JP-L23]